MKTVVYSSGNHHRNAIPGYWNGESFSEPDRLKALTMDEAAAQKLVEDNWKVNARLVRIFEVGDHCTYRIHTDCRAQVVIEVSPNGKTIKVQECNAKLLNGAGSGEPDALNFSPGGFFGHTSGEQRWEITPNEKGAITKVTFRDKSARWKSVGHGAFSPGCEVSGGWSHYYDFNF